MNHSDTVIRVYGSPDPAAALQALAAGVPDRAVERALWLDAGGEALAEWPDPGGVSPALVEAALRCREPALHALEGDFPAEAARNPGAAALLLPLRAGEESLGAVVLLGALEGEGGGWAEVADGLAHVAAQAARQRALEQERDTYRRRAEESEALHVLGLAANRTLDPDEVLQMVARFTRTLLGAHYVTVSAEQGGRLRTLAHAGLRTPPGSDDPFAGRVASAGKPLTVRSDQDPDALDPFHAQEGLRVGLGVPLSLYGQSFGALVVGYRRAYDVTPRDVRLALTLAGHAAVAISNARLHREVERANEELRWSAAAKDRFFASVSHELRTPLNTILGYNSLLIDGVVGPVTPEVHGILERAQRATQNLLYLVNDVLDLSKMEAGRLELVRSPVALGPVVEEALATLEPIAAERGLPLRLEPAGELPALSTDADRVRQILLNLLSNAVKFTERGEVVVSMEPRREGETGWVEVCVRDTGPGIAPQDQERIFHEFEQVTGTSGRGGTGLGLAISRKLARLLGGDLRVESQPGEGSTFILRLPTDA